MQIASGKVVGGRVELESELPEGAAVTVLAPEGDETSRPMLKQRGDSSKRASLAHELKAHRDLQRHKASRAGSILLDGKILFRAEFESTGRQRPTIHSDCSRIARSQDSASAA
jgi:hypothetical protein